MNIKQDYIDILVRITPGPLGKGMTIKQAAKDLGVNSKTIEYRLIQFKKKYPEAWSNFLKLRQMAREDRLKLRWKRRDEQKLCIFTGSGGKTIQLSDDGMSKVITPNFIERMEQTGKIKEIF